ncbi:hypothetical protein PIROE2DRAFT_15610 [Piromyces sp. E2]|nr:hypothetical protein PIROE2DRAFT_15610 [Piromyces sp. E2]|eukprot:OUM58995.1 hypothetical protein PIROE2DRAFT_15610 [Piromyces sp. E2]
MLISTNFLLEFKPNSNHDSILIDNIFSKPIIKTMFLYRKIDVKVINTFDTNLSESNISCYVQDKKEIKENNQYIIKSTNKINLRYGSELDANSMSSLSYSNMVDYNDNHEKSIEANSAPSLLNVVDPSSKNIKRTNALKTNNVPSQSQSNIITRIFGKIKDLQLNNKNKNLKSKDKFNIILKITYVEIRLTISLFFIFIIPVIIYIMIMKDKDLLNKQMYNNLYAKECPSNKIPVIIYTGEFIMLLYYISKIKELYNGRYILRENSIISILSITWIFLDPILNGNNVTYYFVNVPKQHCMIHNSYYCNCTSKKVEHYRDYEIQSINEYLDFYNKNFSFKEIYFNTIKSSKSLLSKNNN